MQAYFPSIIPRSFPWNINDLYVQRDGMSLVFIIIKRKNAMDELTVSFIAEPIMAVSTETYTTGVEVSSTWKMKALAHSLI